MWPLLQLKRRKKQRFTREASFGALPIRNPSVEWDAEASGTDVLLTIPRRDSGWLRILAWVLGVPKERRLQLDQMGSFVWRQCDATHSVKDIAQALQSEYRLSQREATLSLTTYLQTLGKRNLVAFAVDKALLEPSESEAKPREAKPRDAEKEACGEGAKRKPNPPRGRSRGARGKKKR